MEISSSSTGLQYPIRSISLPSRLNPQSIKVEAELNKLKAWETSLVSTIPLCAETVRTGLVGLAELYICVEDLILSPITPHEPYFNTKMTKGGDLSIGSNINAYMCCRKKVKKEIGKGLRQLKKSENRIMSNPLFDVNQYLSMVAGWVVTDLESLHGGIRSNDAKIDVQRTMQRLQALDATIKGLEGGLDCLFRRLIRNRVSLLNISAQ
ncbi:hypothetical protein Acr_05g0014470 [Actinidia rufa]|uniref:Uncharacterized protein n=1 Tax=Actinidia rufa TaxID=165716 RepID=A0A7J0EMU7_9ERIC|nr:hypothetical protein Acr_05g0014470 [Actinidia rufa]